ncbi:hypothetical protein NDU88_002451 [Pleurodeles waltl]|uniref:Uncharacterized protein n=1 Tax=Pleurodeles waltl TaxID=8319 RepID=A0AAV7WPX7_PLEWA|nr:hypothetical protein NDU88_002451 [Pleurodeles waltl]
MRPASWVRYRAGLWAQWLVVLLRLRGPVWPLAWGTAARAGRTLQEAVSCIWALLEQHGASQTDGCFTGQHYGTVYYPCGSPQRTSILEVSGDAVCTSLNAGEPELLAAIQGSRVALEGKSAESGPSKGVRQGEGCGGFHCGATVQRGERCERK